jgi:hypothetical protein
MSPTKQEPSQGKASSLDSEEPTPAPTIWLCPYVSNTLEQARILLLYKPPDASHGYMEEIRTCGNACNGNMNARVIHYLTEPPALSIMNLIRLFEVEEVRDFVKTIKSRTTADYLHTVISNLRLPLCRHLYVSDLLVGKTLPLPNDVSTRESACPCSEGAIPWPPRFRHFLSCPRYAVCQACHTEGSYTAVGLLAMNNEKHGAAKLFLQLAVFRELGCVMDESEPGWKCHALSSSTLADAQENWVRWIQSVKGERPQWKMSGKASKSTGRGLLDTVWKFLGI